MPGSLGHLTSRFFDVLFARSLTTAENATVETWLAPPLTKVFFQQDRSDQRHGYEAGLAVLEGGGDRDAVIAALMHDIGKRHSRLGVVGRSVASVMIKWGLPLTERMILYRDHGLTAANELAALGAPALAVDFALHHHGDRPVSIAPDVWDVLIAADQPNAGKRGRQGISSRVT